MSIEIRYLDVVWRDPETVVKLEASDHPLEIDKTSHDWSVETTTFPAVHHYIGVCAKEADVKHVPYFELSDGSSQELMPIKVPGSKEVWWIQNSGWDGRGNRYLSELYRTAGRVDLVIQGQKIRIKNNTFNFTVAELEYYLADFKNSLWKLVLNNNSAAKGGVGKEMPDCFNDDVLALFHDFVLWVEKIVQKPGMVLTESQGSVPFRKVRPVPKTFREYATKPSAKSLTSRIYNESYDTAENRFIHYCVKRVSFILKSLSRVADAQYRSYTQKIEQEKDSAVNDPVGNVKRVDSKVYDNEIVKLEKDYLELEKYLAGLVSVDQSRARTSTEGEYGSYTIQIGDTYGKSGIAYFSNKLNGDDFRAKYGKYLVVTFPHYIDLLEVHRHLRQCDLKVCGEYVKRKKRNSRGNVFYEIEFFWVKTLSIIQHPWKQKILNLQDRRKQLEVDNWVSPMSREELQDRLMEREVSAGKVELYENMRSRMSRFSSAIPSLYARLVKLESFFKVAKVRIRSDCPNTMVFIQSPSYASAKSEFKKISSLNGLDELMLNSLMLVDDIGLVNVANIYEKWCFLQIVNVLNQVYGFEVECGWQRALINAVLSNSVDIEIKFKSDNRQQHIVLTYEKVLQSGRRPDFVIDLFSNEKRSRLVMDAKFRGKISESQLQEIVRELYEQKNYSEDQENQVFIIHPTPNVISDRTSPLMWGGQCDYGQSHEVGHRYGSVFVVPSLTYSGSIDHLQRLIGMFLQQQGEILKTDSGNLSWHNMSCISCGNANHDKLRFTYEPTKAGSERWLIQCESCRLLSVKTICRDCHHSLFKNGPKWTYHRTRAEQISNVVCPACETFL